MTGRDAATVVLVFGCALGLVSFAALVVHGALVAAGLAP